MNDKPLKKINNNEWVMNQNLGDTMTRSTRPFFCEFFYDKSGGTEGFTRHTE